MFPKAKSAYLCIVEAQRRISKFINLNLFLKMDVNDFMALKAFQGGSDISSYEQAMLAEKSGRHPSNAALWGVGLGVFGAAAAIGAWIYSGTSIGQSNKYNMRAMDQLATFNLAERNERIGYQAAANKTTIDIITGAQASSSSTSNALAQAEATLLTQSLLGNLNQCPQKVALYQDAKACGCGC